MPSVDLSFISFEPSAERFTAFLALESFTTSTADPEVLLEEASLLYEQSITRLRHLLSQVDRIRNSGRVIPARKIWDIGNAIFKLTKDMAKLSVQIDDLYAHLVRDLQVNRKWLEKVITFRRYLPQKKYIPPSLNWGKCEKGTRRVAKRLLKEYG